jgi:predicted GIY-YIG superfamily endonuclease
MTPTTYQLYALIDPTTNEVKYIGLTTRPLHRRLESHLADKRNDNLRQRWVRYLLLQDIKPEITLLNTFTSKEEATQEETRTISHFRNKGSNLTNSLR